MTRKTCADCGRRGTRGFFEHLLRTYKEGHSVWVCSSAKACLDRQYRAFMGEGDSWWRR